LEGDKAMAYQGSKGWYIQQLKHAGITKHPIEHRKIELYKTYIVRNLYLEIVFKQKNTQD
jgi:hypothetical protein